MLYAAYKLVCWSEACVLQYNIIAIDLTQYQRAKIAY